MAGRDVFDLYKRDVAAPQAWIRPVRSSTRLQLGRKLADCNKWPILTNGTKFGRLEGDLVGTRNVYRSVREQILRQAALELAGRHDHLFGGFNRPQHGPKGSGDLELVGK